MTNDTDTRAENCDLTTQRVIIINPDRRSREKGRVTMAGNSWLKAVVLVVLTVQTSVFHLVLRLSRSAGASHYSPLAAVVSDWSTSQFPSPYKVNRLSQPQALAIMQKADTQTMRHCDQAVLSNSINCTACLQLCISQTLPMALSLEPSLHASQFVHFIVESHESQSTSLKYTHCTLLRELS